MLNIQTLDDPREDLTNRDIVARVVSNDDEDQLQRIKVEIPTIMEGTIEELPWVGPIHSARFGIGKTFGVVRIPAVGSLVRVKFQNGDLTKGLYEGSPVPGAFKLPEDLAANYPHRQGFVDPIGNLYYFDIKTGEVKWSHISGLTYLVKPNGEVNLYTPDKVKWTANGDITLNSNSDIRILANKLHVDNPNGLFIDNQTAVTHLGSYTQTGDFTQTGNQIHTGNVTRTGDENVTGTRVQSGTIQVDNILLKGVSGSYADLTSVLASRNITW